MIDEDFEEIMKEQNQYIEELEERLKAATDDAKEAETYAKELEAKLAKAVEFIEIVERCGNGPLWDLARVTLAELTGGKDD